MGQDSKTFFLVAAIHAAIEAVCLVALTIIAPEEKAWPLVIVSFHGAWTCIGHWRKPSRYVLVVPLILAADMIFLAVPGYLPFLTVSLNLPPSVS